MTLAHTLLSEEQREYHKIRAAASLITSRAVIELLPGSAVKTALKAEWQAWRLRFEAIDDD